MSYLLEGLWLSFLLLLEIFWLPLTIMAAIALIAWLFGRAKRK